MAEIRVTPQDLRSAADVIETGSRNISRDVSSTAQVIEAAINGSSFSGQRADALIAHYRQTQSTMESWPDQLIQFASLLRSAANAFETADKGTATGAGTTSAAGAMLDAQQLMQQADALRDDLRAKWDKLKQLIEDMGADGLQVFATFAGSLVAAAMTGGAAAPAAVKALIGSTPKILDGLSDVGPAIDLFKAIQDDRQKYLDLNTQAINAGGINAGFNTQQGLDELHNTWANLNTQAQQEQMNIIQDWSMGPKDLGSQLIFAIDPLAKPVAQIATFDTYFDLWINSQMRIDQSQAYLQAIDLRRASLPK